MSLAKGENINLSKSAPGLSKIKVGLGWDPAVTTGVEFDLDAVALRLNSLGKVRNSEEDFIFYINKTPVSGDKSITHTGDNRTGNGTGDDESVLVDLNGQPADVMNILFGVTIHEGQARGQNFGQVRNAYIRILNEADGAEIARFNLTEDLGSATCMGFGEVYRYGGEWKFRAIGLGSKDDLGTFARAYGVQC